jgi:hypothetical protein
VLTGDVDEFRKLSEPLRAAAGKRSLQEIEDTASALMLWFRGIGPDAHKAIYAKFAEVNTIDNNWKLIFRAFFIVGSIVYGVTWWMSYFASANKRESGAKRVQDLNTTSRSKNGAQGL